MCVCVCVCVCVSVCVCVCAQLCLTLCNPVDCSPPGSSVHGTFQARILEGVALSFYLLVLDLAEALRLSCPLQPTPRVASTWRWPHHLPRPVISCPATSLHLLIFQPTSGTHATLILLSLAASALAWTTRQSCAPLPSPTERQVELWKRAQATARLLRLHPPLMAQSPHSRPLFRGPPPTVTLQPAMFPCQSDTSSPRL